MKQRLLLAAFAVLALSAPAMADPLRLAQAEELLPPHEIISLVRANGFDPIEQPLRRGPNYTLRAIDEYDREVDLVVSARFGDVLSVRPVVAGTAARVPPRGPAIAGPYQRSPSGYVPSPPPRSVYSAGRPGDGYDDANSVYAPRPPAPVPGALPRSSAAVRPPAVRAAPVDADDVPPPSSPRVITSTAPDRSQTQSGALPPPPERFPQRAAVMPPPPPKKPPMKRAAAMPPPTPLPKPRPVVKVGAVPAPPPLPAPPPQAAAKVPPPPPEAPLPQATEKAPPPAAAQPRVDDPVPN